MKNLQFGDNDLIGNKFNGHDLHLYLREKGIDSYHLVDKKESDDPYTFIHDWTNSVYSLGIIKNYYFQSADIVHMHLIHNTLFDLNYLPLMTQLKPVVWTLHDPWALGAHCIHHFDCEKWQTYCHDCQYLDKQFAVPFDDTALTFELKKIAIQKSSVSVIVASKWMYDKVKLSPFFYGKPLYLLPFGINQKVFCPKNSGEAKKKWGISEDSVVLLLRADVNIYKGLNIIKLALESINTTTEVIIMTVALVGVFDEFKHKFKVLDNGWINDDELLASLYQACDIFLMPSLQETFGMMAIEAMSCGKTVLSLDCPGSALPDVINSPVCGIAVAEENFANTLNSLINNPSERINRGNLSLSYAHQHYDKDTYIMKMTEIYADIIKNHIQSEKSKIILKQLKKQFK